MREEKTFLTPRLQFKLKQINEKNVENQLLDLRNLLRNKEYLEMQKRDEIVEEMKINEICLYYWLREFLFLCVCRWAEKSPPKRHEIKKNEIKSSAGAINVSKTTRIIILIIKFLLLLFRSCLFTNLKLNIGFN